MSDVCERCGGVFHSRERGAVDVQKRCERCNRLCCTGCAGQFDCCKWCGKLVCYDCNALVPSIPYTVCKSCINVAHEKYRLRDDVSGQIKAYRLKHNLSQEELGNRIGVCKLSVHRWEKKLHPPGRMATRMMEELDILEKR